MNMYDYNQMIEDYQFLNQVGRLVTSKGRDIQNAKITSTAPGQTPRRPPATVQRRDALAKQLAYQKLPIMLLPDGMSKRKANRTHWDAKAQKMLFTAHLVLPCATNAHLRENGLFFHRIEGKTEVAAFVSAELSRVCADEPPLKRARVESPDISMPYESSALSNPGILLMRVYEKRLRNESSAKYLDWWARKGAALEGAQPPQQESTMPSMVPPHVLHAVSQLRSDKDSVPTSPLAPNAHHYYAHVIPGVTFDTLLRSLPASFGIVEYFDLEWWHIESLRDAERRGQVQFVPLEKGEARDNKRNDACISTSNATSISLAECAEREAPLILHSENKLESPATLVGYASDSD